MKRAWTYVATLTLALLAPAVAPGLAAAEPNAVLYEVTENLRLGLLKVDERFAAAVLSGTVAAGTSVCPADLAQFLGTDHCVLTAMATDKVDTKTGVGPVVGTFRVVIQGDNPVDGAELVILRGTLQGSMNLAMALLGKDGIPDSGDELPLGTLEQGRWTAQGVPGGPLQGVKASGTLTGTFRLPFVIGSSPPLYLGDAGPVPVAPNEYSLGVPTVKLEITFVDKH